MLTNTFLHIPYVCEKREQELWRNGIRTWDDFLASKNNLPNRDLIEKHIEISKEQYKKNNHEFFSKKLLSKYHWRAYDDFRKNSCFLDIETTGLSKTQSDITLIGIYDGKESKVFINGKNMEKFPEEIKKYSYIVTFNGALFDIPFIKEKFPDIEFNQFHADLRFVLRQLGYSGGLKNIEKEFNIEREDDLKGMTGLDAVKLWHYYKRYNDKKALDKLVRYNIEDIENLKILMDYSYEKLKEKSFTL
jgi:uncharacterized protein